MDLAQAPTSYNTPRNQRSPSRPSENALLYYKHVKITSPSVPSVTPSTKDSSPLGPRSLLHWSANTYPNQHQLLKVTLTNNAKTSSPPSTNPKGKTYCITRHTRYPSLYPTFPQGEMFGHICRLYTYFRPYIIRLSWKISLQFILWYEISSSHL